MGDQNSTAKQSATVATADEYARDAAAGRVVCSRWVQLAAKRHLRDIEAGKKRGIYFDRRAAQHALDFFGFLRHSKGEWGGHQFELADWQVFIVAVLFGWKRSDGLRRFRTAYVAIARKNGKSTLLAGIGLYLFFADGEPGAEVYCAATKKDQARIVFQEAVRMRDKSPSLTKRIAKFRDNLNVVATSSKFEPLGADEDTLDGLNIHAALVDELHAHKTRQLYDVLDTATGARRQPLMFSITTAGFNRESICFKQNEYGERVLEGTVQDDTFFAYICGLDPGDEWEDEANWPKANPNLNISVKLDDLRRKAAKAKQDPSALNSFLRLHLNVWTQVDTRWMPMDKWNQCAGFDLKGRDSKTLRAEVEKMLEGRACIVGLDLSSRIDITALVALFPPVEGDPRWFLLPYFYVPEEKVRERVSQDRVPYDVWIREGFLYATEGNIVDYDIVKAKIEALRTRYDVQEVAFDPWNATQIAVDLGKLGATVVEFRQGFASMSEPTKQLMSLVLTKKLAHLANPILRWMASNLVVKQDEAGNIKPNKDKSTEKIDGIVATVMALGRAISKPPEESGSVYDTRGVLLL